jgi:3'-phosphoadenosine 5'-phosphosulfate sulfotransferase (PAPS reductase)/FAD synthetase
VTTIAWFSGGITSAVACKLALGVDPNLEIIFIETGSHHPDLLRFLHDCEKWFGKNIQILQHETIKSVEECLKKYRFINSPAGARCTSTLKSDVRKRWEKTRDDIDTYVWGFEFGAKEENRAKRIVQRQPDKKHIFPLIEAKIDKPAAIKFVQEAKIEIPMMYKLGYHNNNCLGCVKGGMAYWNKIRVDFPEIFERTAKLEREIGAKCLKSYYLDELPPDAGRGQPPLVTECGSTGEGCEIEKLRWYNTRD